MVRRKGGDEIVEGRSRDRGTRRHECKVSALEP